MPYLKFKEKHNILKKQVLDEVEAYLEIIDMKKLPFTLPYKDYEINASSHGVTILGEFYSYAELTIQELLKLLEHFEKITA